MPVRHCAASLTGTMRPLAVSVSSSGSTTRWSSSGSSVTSVAGIPSSITRNVATSAVVVAGAAPGVGTVRIGLLVVLAAAHQLVEEPILLDLLAQAVEAT